MKTFYSVIVPVFNEEGNAKKLAQEIHQSMSTLKKTYEIIFIDDGSKDNTVKELKKIKKVKIIELRKNFGQSSALFCGIKNAKGEIIITMDGDRQNDPTDIPKLLKKLDEGYDAVSGWRKNRKDTILKHLFSRFSFLVRKIILNDHLHDSGCSLKAYKKVCFKDFELYGELHRYIAEILSYQGFKIGEVVVSHRSRKEGKTKYGVERIMRGFLDIFLISFWQRYSGRPLHLFGGAGLLMGFLGTAGGFYSIYLKIFQNIDLSNTFLPTLATFLVIIGIQFFVLGIIMDVLIRTYTKGEPQYKIGKIHNT